MAEQVRVRVLRSVPVSEDGIRARQIVAGTDDVVPAGLYIGLFRERYVDPLEATEAVAVPVAEPTLEPSEQLEVKHVGRGKWYVVRGEDRVKGPFDDKDDAEAALAEIEA